MIVFHEGLPGSGKSYETMVARIIPALAKGRRVVAYVEGLDHEAIAPLAEISVERCKELLRALTREEMAKWLELTEDNALHVYDEAQNFWGNRDRLTKQQTEFVTEHRHRGIDVILMGQDLRDVNATWRRRVELKLCFLKLNGLGAASKYSVTTYRHLGQDEYKKVGVTFGKYDPKYFGTYKSHVSEDTNTEVYTDKRAQIWHHPGVKYGGPVLLVVALFAGNAAWKFFHPKPREEQTAKASPPGPRASEPVRQAAATTTAQAAAVAAAPVDQRAPIERRLMELTNKGRIRLAGLISSKNHTSGIVEWVQGGSTVLERMSLDALRALGVAVLVTDDTSVQLAVGDYRDLATPWPLEDLARVSDANQSAIRGPAPPVATEPMPSMGSFGPPRTVELPGGMNTANGPKPRS